MKIIGIIGGMSWESTADYYRLVNQEVADRLGGLHSAELVLYSVDFAPIEAMQVEGRWEEAAQVLADVARRVEAAGADLLLLATNTMHKVADVIQEAVSIPLLHIADPTGAAIRDAGIDTVGLLGTRYTMEEAFYRGRLEERFGLTVVVPDVEQRALIDRVIFRELCLGITKSESKRRYLEIIDDLARHGAEGVILGCTEIGMLVSADDTDLPLFDTTRLHVVAAVDAALEHVEGFGTTPSNF